MSLILNPALTQFDLEVARGNVPGMAAVVKFGFNSDVDTTSDPEDVWDAGGVYVPPTAARVHNLVSDDANDTSAGSGLQTVRVYGLDAALALQEETVALNGVTPVATSGSYLRMFRMQILTAGAGEVNAGTITATAVTDATVSAQINVGLGQTGMAVYSVPTGKTAYMTRAWASQHMVGGGSGAAQLTLYERTGIETAVPAARMRHRVGFDVTGTSARSWRYIPPKVFVGPCDIWWRCDVVTVSNTAIGAGFDLIVVDGG